MDVDGTIWARLKIEANTNSENKNDKTILGLIYFVCYALFTTIDWHLNQEKLELCFLNELTMSGT